MEDNTDKNFDFNTQNLLQYITQNRKPLFIITAASLLISFIVTLLLPPEYKSTSVIFPTASTSISNSLLGINLPKKEILNFGKEEEVEQMLQVLKSDEIKSRIVKKYNLMEHYGVRNSMYPQTKLDQEYNENINFIRTPYFSVEIEVFDRDPVIAANIANDIVLFVDTTINLMLRERATKAFQLVEKEYHSLLNHKKTLEDTLKSIQEKGVYHYEYQSQALSEALGKALADGKMHGAELIENKLKILAQYGGQYISIRDLLERETEKLSILESKFAEAKVDVTQNLPHKFVVSKAVVAERKTYPIEWLIIMLSVLFSFTFGVFTLIFLDRLKKKT